MDKQLIFSVMMVASVLPLCAQENFEFKLQTVLGRIGETNSDRKGTDLWQALEACKQKPETDESKNICINALLRFEWVTSKVLYALQSDSLAAALLADIDQEIKSWDSYFKDHPNVTRGRGHN